MSDGRTDGLDGLSYTTVTPRASLKSDANKILIGKISHSYLIRAHKKNHQTRFPAMNMYSNEERKGEARR